MFLLFLIICLHVWLFNLPFLTFEEPTCGPSGPSWSVWIAYGTAGAAGVAGRGRRRGRRQGHRGSGNDVPKTLPSGLDPWSTTCRNQISRPGQSVTSIYSSNLTLENAEGTLGIQTLVRHNFSLGISLTRLLLRRSYEDLPVQALWCKDDVWAVRTMYVR